MSITRDSLMTLEAYTRYRKTHKAEVIARRRLRSVQLGEHISLQFEDEQTIRYQIQEMIRAEQMVRERDIQHELETYNAVLGGPGELGATLLIEIPDEADRAGLLRAWRDLPGHLWMTFTDGTRAQAAFDPEQMNEEKLSSVQFLKFAVGNRTPAGLRSELPALREEADFSDATRRALQEDLGQIVLRG